MPTLADGPAMYFGGTIETFALPLGAFIVITVALYFLFRANHSGPKLKYLTPGSVASVTTREPGSAPASPVAAVEVLAADPETAITPESITSAPAKAEAAEPGPAEPEATGPEAEE